MLTLMVGRKDGEQIYVKLGTSKETLSEHGNTGQFWKGTLGLLRRPSHITQKMMVK